MVLPERECPHCFVTLEEETVRGEKGTVTVDVCPECDGLFLDQGEIEQITGHKELDQLLTDYLGVDSDSRLVCPDCGSVMDAEDAGGVELDVCLECHGVWADDGEIEALLDVDPETFLDFDLDKEAEIYDQRRTERADALRALRNTFMFWKKR